MRCFSASAMRKRQNCVRWGSISMNGGRARFASSRAGIPTCGPSTSSSRRSPGCDDRAGGELSSAQEPGERLRDVAIPFAIFTAIWGSTWIVIRGQLGVVAPEWSVAYRFAIAAVGMALLASVRGESLRLGRKAMLPALVLGFCQFCINFDAVYLAERHITSGVVATVFALLLIPSSLMAWAWLGQRPSSRFLCSSLVAVSGIILLFGHELREHAASARQILSGIALTSVGMLGASTANVLQARPEIRRFPLFAMLAWSMAAGA